MREQRYGTSSEQQYGRLTFVGRFLLLPYDVAGCSAGFTELPAGLVHKAVNLRHCLSDEHEAAA